jgi:hypothetical protein
VLGGGDVASQPVKVIFGLGVPGGAGRAYTTSVTFGEDPVILSLAPRQFDANTGLLCDEPEL